ncbi:MAG: HAD hydrolase family protein, partial [Chloroflexi bacterium]|nr:HAD hydrolase family protein [Chloroflexota bacterium]
PMVFLAQLARAGIQTRAGECVLEADACDGPAILAVLRALELPLSLVFNRGRVMVLPQGITKATGLRELLRASRLSEHNTIAIGDAENDHSLLELSEVGTAVAWGSTALQASADVILPGAGPPAVAAFIKEIVARPRLPTPYLSRRHRFTLGHSDTGKLLALAVPGRNLLIAGDPHTGKSWLAGLLCEQLILQRYCVCVVDPEGEYTTLQSLPGVEVWGGDSLLPRPAKLAQMLQYPDVNLVVDLSRLALDDKRGYVASLLSTLVMLRRRTGLPHRIVLEEAHYFLGGPEVSALIDLDHGGYTFVTYRPSQLHPTAVAAGQSVLVTRLTDQNEIDATARLGGRADVTGWAELCSSLAVGEVALLPVTTDVTATPRRLLLVPRLTAHVRHRQKYLDVPIADCYAFVFTQHGVPTGVRARNMAELTAAIRASSAEALDEHLRRWDFSSWIANVFADYPLAARLNEIERRYATDQSVDAREAVVDAIAERYVPENALETVATLPTSSG